MSTIKSNKKYSFTSNIFVEMNHFDNIFNYTPMNQPSTLPNLAPALIAAIAETQDVITDSVNPYHESRYASLSQHLKVLKPIFAKHGLAIIQMPTSGFNDGGIGIRTIVLHTSGEMISSDMTIDAPLEKGVDKAGNPYERKGFTGQQVGTLLSYIRRYGLAAVSGVASQDDDGESDRVANGGEPAKAIAKVNYIPNPAAVRTAPVAAPAPQFVKAPQAVQPVQGDIDPSIVVPFGNNKGQAIGSLGKKDLEFWATKWEPRPYEKTGKVTKKDAMLKATAVHLFSANVNDLTKEVDDVPFGDEDNPF